ncbi:MAG: glycoside hydrolase family 28 protein [Bacteroidia bacterium]
MEIASLPQPLRILPAIFLILLAGCGSPDSGKKSKLVTDLESVFYNPAFARVPEKVFQVSDYGAVGDGKTLNTDAIQQTIDAAAAAGGGKVVFPAGDYLTGAVFIKSNVEFHIGEGVTLIAIPDDLYYPERRTRVAGIEMDWPAALINVYEEKNVRITGKGTIFGSGKYWWDKFWGDPPRSGGMWVDYQNRNIRWAVDYDCKRVRPVVIYKSENVLLKDFTVKQAGFWTISLTYSEKVHVDGLIIRNNIDGYGPSSDGINTDSSKDILVENCDIDCNDDNLCIKAGRDADGLRVNKPAENIVYRNCITRAGHGLFTIGSETSGGMRNIEVYGLEAIGTNTGIRFKSAKVRGGLIENVWFHDIKMTDVNSPFQFELNWYPEYSYPQIPDEIPEEERPEWWKTMTQVVEPPEKGIPEFRDILLTDIEVKNAQRAFYANAYPEKPIHDLTWKNIAIEAESGGTVTYARDWKMENVSITLKKHDPTVLENSSGIALPEPVFLNADPVPHRQEPGDLEKQIYERVKEDSHFHIAPVDLKNMVLIEPGDTAKFSEEMKLYVLSENPGEISYFEPLGDGFYISPVSVASKNNGKEIKISAERNHHWTIVVKSAFKPKSIAGAESWEYNSEKQELHIEKSGAAFELKIE